MNTPSTMPGAEKIEQLFMDGFEIARRCAPLVSEATTTFRNDALRVKYHEVDGNTEVMVAVDENKLTTAGLNLYGMLSPQGQVAELYGDYRGPAGQWFTGSNFAIIPEQFYAASYSIGTKGITEWHHILDQAALAIEAAVPSAVTPEGFGLIANDARTLLDTLVALASSSESTLDPRRFDVVPHQEGYSGNIQAEARMLVELASGDAVVVVEYLKSGLSSPSNKIEVHHVMTASAGPEGIHGVLPSNANGFHIYNGAPSRSLDSFMNEDSNAGAIGYALSRAVRQLPINGQA